MKNKFLLILFLVFAPVFAHAQTVINHSSPIKGDFDKIYEIYHNTCLIGLDNPDYPQWSIDIIEQDYKNKLRSTPFKSFGIIRTTVFDAYENGRALAIADLDFMFKESLCAKYANTHAINVINDQRNWSMISASYEKVPTVLQNPMFDLVKHDKKSFDLTPRSAYEGSCKIMFVFMRGRTESVNQVDVSIDIVKNLMWRGVNPKLITARYGNILSGIKFGNFLFDYNKSSEECRG